MAKKRETRNREGAQSEHARLMDMASSHPGVAEAMAVYDAVAGHALTVRRDTPIIRYSTGGNTPQARAG